MRMLPAVKHEMYREATGAAWLGLGVNLLLGLVKLVAGWNLNALALLVDAVNSLGDALSSLVVLVALYVAQYPPDDEHPYGHTRAEAIGGSNVAVLIFVSALAMGWEALRQLGAPAEEAPSLWVMLVAGANVAIKETLYRYKLWVGERTGSSALLAGAWDHRSDALCSLAVLAGVALVHWGNLPWADAAAALAVAVAILWSATQLFRQSVDELMDVQADEPFVRDIRAAALRVEGVCNVEQLRVRKSGLEYFADMHLEVPAHMTVAQGHEVGHRVKDRLLAEFAALCDVLVHLEPYPHVHAPPTEDAPPGDSAPAAEDSAAEDSGAT